MDDRTEALAEAYDALMAEAVQRGLTVAVIMPVAVRPLCAYAPLPPLALRRAASTARAQRRRLAQAMIYRLYTTTSLSDDAIAERVGYRSGRTIAAAARREGWQRPDGYRHGGPDGRERLAIIRFFDGPR